MQGRGEGESTAGRAPLPRAAGGGGQTRPQPNGRDRRGPYSGPRLPPLAALPGGPARNTAARRDAGPGLATYQPGGGTTAESRREPLDRESGGRGALHVTRADGGCEKGEDFQRRSVATFGVIE